jgi:streptogramin lyase
VGEIARFTLLTLALGISGVVSAAPDIREYAVPSGSHPHDVAPVTLTKVTYKLL